MPGQIYFPACPPGKNSIINEYCQWQTFEWIRIFSSKSGTGHTWKNPRSISSAKPSLIRGRHKQLFLMEQLIFILVAGWCMLRLSWSVVGWKELGAWWHPKFPSQPHLSHCSSAPQAGKDTLLSCSSLKQLLVYNSHHSFVILEAGRCQKR